MKGKKLTNEELEQRYLALNKLRAETNKEFDELIKNIKREKYVLSYEINKLINKIKDQTRSKAEAIKKQALTSKKLEKLYHKAKNGWVCNKCKKKFGTLTGIHIHLGRKKCHLN